MPTPTPTPPTLDAAPAAHPPALVATDAELQLARDRRTELFNAVAVTAGLIGLVLLVVAVAVIR